MNVRAQGGPKMSMKRTVLVFVLVIISLLGTSVGAKNTAAIFSAGGGLTAASSSPDFGRIPLYFIPNQGFAPPEVLFMIKASRYTLSLTKEGLSLSVQRQNARDGREETSSRLVFLGTNPQTRLDGADSDGHRVNYFIGSDPARWRTDVPTWRAALYRDLYPDIDLKVYGVEKTIEYDWIVRPGGDLKSIRFKAGDRDGVRMDAEGNLLVSTAFGDLVHRKPTAYQSIGGRRISVAAFFERRGPESFGFRIGPYDRRHDLIIDPIVYSTFLGGNGFDNGYGIAIDNTGAAYVVGTTSSSGFPLKNPIDNTRNGSFDVFVTKLAPAGNALAYSTFLGGRDSEDGYAIAVDATGCAYITGKTLSADFPVKAGYDSALNGSMDVFVTKLAPAGNSIVFSTYLGGSNAEIGRGIAVDKNKAVYVVGFAGSANFPMKNAFDNSFNGNGDVFVTKFAPSGASLVYSTFLGGHDGDDGNAIAVDQYGSAYVTGFTASDDFPMKKAYDTTLGSTIDAFVTKFNPSGKTLAYSTYLGGGGINEYGWGIAVDRKGSAYVAGQTDSPDFPVVNAFDPTFNPSKEMECFLTKFSPAGSTLAYSTYLGGKGDDRAFAVAVTADGVACLTGSTSSKDFPTHNAFAGSLHGSADVFVTKFAETGKALLFSTYLGGGSWEEGRAIAIRSNGEVVVTGTTTSADFPRKNPFDNSYNFNDDVFVAKLK
jgi:hypothetical protein